MDGYDKVLQGLDQGALGNQKVVQEAAAGPKLPLGGKGPDYDPQDHPNRLDDLVGRGVSPINASMSALEALIFPPMSSSPRSPVHTQKPPAGQARLCPGLTNVPLVTKLYSTPPPRGGSVRGHRIHDVTAPSP